MENLIETGLRMLSEFIGNPYQFENDTFSWQEYCYCEEGCERCNNQGFVYKPTSFSIKWYKHLGRGMSASTINKEEFCKVMIACLRSLEKLP